MAKKREGKKMPETATPKRIQYPFRPDDPELLRAAEECGSTMRQSINGVLNLALIEFLKAHGLWPRHKPRP